MPELLALSDFESHVTAHFRARLGSEESLDLELVKAEPLQSGGGHEVPGLRRAPFSLIFRGPRERPLEQRIYELEHPSLGPLPIFLVPIGPEPEKAGFRYQAVFN
jgi:hypothetical protein